MAVGGCFPHHNGGNPSHPVRRCQTLLVSGWSKTNHGNITGITHHSIDGWNLHFYQSSKLKFFLKLIILNIVMIFLFIFHLRPFICAMMIFLR